MSDTTSKIISAAIEVHDYLDPGLLESMYEMCLAKEFDLRNIQYERQITYPLKYKNIHLENAYRIDFLVEDKIILEIKAVEVITKTYLAQVMTYLRLLNKNIGLLLNFNVPYLRDGINRISI